MWTKQLGILKQKTVYEKIAKAVVIVNIDIRHTFQAMVWLDSSP
jgi:hypothetical protein